MILSSSNVKLVLLVEQHSFMIFDDLVSSKENTDWIGLDALQKVELLFVDSMFSFLSFYLIFSI